MSEAPAGRTEIQRDEQHRDRWSGFGERAGIRRLEERLSPAALKRYELFAPYDDDFLERLSPDVAVCRWESGAVLFEEGTYIDLAFFIAEGSVAVYLAGAGGADDRASARRPIFDPERTCYGAIPALAVPSVAALAPISRTVLAPASGQHRGERHGGLPPGGITFLATMDFDLPRGAAVELGPGELFGEIGAMSGWPQSVTARTTSASTLLQIRLPALRALRRRSPALKERLDALYRRLSLADQLAATPLFAGCDAAFLAALKESVELISLEPGQVLARRGEPALALYLVRSGFLRLSQPYGSGEMVVNYLSKGMTLGEVELLVGDTGGWTSTAAAVEHAELVAIPAAELERLLARMPPVAERLWESTVARIREAGFARRNPSHSEFIDTALERGLVQGNSILVIDLETCTRCDDCVRACAATHGGRPRFVREGDKVGSLQVAHACYHCRDPVCLVGCPTGAIHRAGVGAVVAIDESICIGCGSCARACPYDAILMHDTETRWPDDAVPESLRGRQRLVASKCDLCHTRSDGPACVKNCPNGCAYRVGSLAEFETLLARR